MSSFVINDGDELVGVLEESFENAYFRNLRKCSELALAFLIVIERTERVSGVVLDVLEIALSPSS